MNVEYTTHTTLSSSYTSYYRTVALPKLFHNFSAERQKNSRVRNIKNPNNKVANYTAVVQSSPPRRVRRPRETSIIPLSIKYNKSNSARKRKTRSLPLSRNPETVIINYKIGDKSPTFVFIYGGRGSSTDVPLFQEIGRKFTPCK